MHLMFRVCENSNQSKKVYCYVLKSLATTTIFLHRRSIFLKLKIVFTHLCEVLYLTFFSMFPRFLLIPPFSLAVD
jgi:hypothetical protein